MCDHCGSIESKCVDDFTEVIAHLFYSILVSCVRFVGQAMSFELDSDCMKACRCKERQRLMKNPRCTSPAGNQDDGIVIDGSSFDDSYSKTGCERDEPRCYVGKSFGIQTR